MEQKEYLEWFFSKYAIKDSDMRKDLADKVQIIYSLDTEGSALSKENLLNFVEETARRYCELEQNLVDTIVSWGSYNRSCERLIGCIQALGGKLEQSLSVSKYFKKATGQLVAKIAEIEAEQAKDRKS